MEIIYPRKLLSNIWLEFKIWINVWVFLIDKSTWMFKRFVICFIISNFGEKPKWQRNCFSRSNMTRPLWISLMVCSSMSFSSRTPLTEREDDTGQPLPSGWQTSKPWQWTLPCKSTRSSIYNLKIINKYYFIKWMLFKC